MLQLSDSELQRLDESGINYLISCNEKRIMNWSTPDYIKVELEKEIVELQKLKEGIS